MTIWGDRKKETWKNGWDIFTICRMGLDLAVRSLTDHNMPHQGSENLTSSCFFGSIPILGDCFDIALHAEIYIFCTYFYVNLYFEILWYREADLFHCDLLCDVSTWIQCTHFSEYGCLNAVALCQLTKTVT